MLTATTLDLLREECEQELRTEPEIAEALEERADVLWARAERIATTLSPEPANDGELFSTASSWPIDQLAAALDLRLIEEELPGLVLGAYVRAQGLVFVQRRLPLVIRGATVTHECGHAALTPGAPHAEVWYLALALLFPRRLLSSLADGRRPSAFALLSAVPYRAAYWAAEKRARMLTRIAGF